uniref:Uncharacterized protein n=1 Tax=Arundo donax TaxID=35708 RepID=A0A0A8Z029_ARUDO
MPSAVLSHPTCAKEVLVRCSFSALHAAGVRLVSHDPS